MGIGNFNSNPPALLYSDSERFNKLRGSPFFEDFNDVAPDDPPMPAVMCYAAKIVRVALYFLLLAVPLSAIVGAWLEGHPLTVFLIGDVAPPLRLAHAAGNTIATIHAYLGDAIVWLAGLHAAAGLFHHFFLRDRVLRSMLPERDLTSNRFSLLSAALFHSRSGAHLVFSGRERADSTASRVVIFRQR